MAECPQTLKEQVISLLIQLTVSHHPVDSVPLRGVKAHFLMRSTIDQQCAIERVFNVHTTHTIYYDQRGGVQGARPPALPVIPASVSACYCRHFAFPGVLHGTHMYCRAWCVCACGACGCGEQEREAERMANENLNLKMRVQQLEEMLGDRGDIEESMNIWDMRSALSRERERIIEEAAREVTERDELLARSRKTLEDLRAENSRLAERVDGMVSSEQVLQRQLEETQVKVRGRVRVQERQMGK